MNKVYKLIWSCAQKAWVVCSELGKKTKSNGTTYILVGGVCLSISSISFAIECTPESGNGTIGVVNGVTGAAANCEVSSIPPIIGNSSPYNIGFQVFSSQGVNRSITVTNDLTTTIKGAGGIAVYELTPDHTASFNAVNKTINLTLEDLDPPNNTTLLPKTGAGASHGGVINIGTLNLTMLDLPAGTNRDERFEHYGVVTGSTVSAAETASFNGIYSKALFDNLTINMQSSNNVANFYSSYPLLAGIRVIQGAGQDSGLGSAGYVAVANNLNINLDGTSNDVTGIYISGRAQADGDGNEIVPEVHIHNSDITVKSTSTRANAILLGKTSGAGAGTGRLYSTGKMFIDTTKAINSGAIDLIWQGAILDANADTSETEIKAGKEAITISGTASQNTDETMTTFNNLKINKTATDTASLIRVNSSPKYVFSARGDETSLIANTGNNAYLINVGTTNTQTNQVTYNFADGYMQGLVNKYTSSVLNMNVSDAAVWQLAENANSKQATFSELNLTNGAILRASLLQTDPALDTRANFILKGNVKSSSSTLDLVDGHLKDTLTIDGDYVGTNGVLALDTQFANDDSLTDKLIVTGNASGNTLLDVKNVGGAGDQTINGIEIIQTGSSTNDAFALKEGDYITVGVYEYSLHKHDNENWYLESKLADVKPPEPGPEDPVYTPDAGSYIANQTMANALFTTRLEDREGASRYQHLEKDNGNVWIRAYGAKNKFQSMSHQLKTDGNSFVTQLGVGLVTLGDEDQWNVGVMGGYAHYTGDTHSKLTQRKSSSRVEGYSVGGYGTWYAHPVEKRGAFVDTWVLWNDFKNKVDTANQKQYKYDSSGVTASIEVGGDYLLNKNGDKDWWIQPQGQLIYQGVQADDFIDAQGVKISSGSDNLQARLGFKTYLEIPTDVGVSTNYRPYLALNWIHNTTPNVIEANNVGYAAEGSKDLGEIKLGLEGQITPNSQAWFNVSYVSGGSNNTSYQGNIGWKYNF